MPELERWQVQLNVVSVVEVGPGEDATAVAIANLEAIGVQAGKVYTVTGQGSKRVYDLGEYAPAVRQVVVVDPQAEGRAPGGGGPPRPTEDKLEYGQVGQQPNGQWKITFADGEVVPMPEEYMPW